MATNKATVKHPREVEKLNRRQIANVRQSASANYTARVMNRVAAQALGELTDSKGNPIEMSMAELRASELVLKKTLPDLSMVTQVDNTDSLESMTREELGDLLANLLSDNPALAKLSSVQHAVDDVNTVLTIEKDGQD